jgi:hypothetical protein
MSNQADSTSPKMADRMPALAAEFAEACKKDGLNLDFLPRTLPLADKVLAARRSDSQQLAAYLGEVIRRETGASWFDFDGRPMLNVGDYQADPVAIVSGLLESGRAVDGDVVITSMKAYCEMLSRMQRVWLEGTVLGTYESMAALRTSIAPDARLAGTIVAQSQLAVRTAKFTFDEALDFSSESLEQVERIMSKLHQQAAGGPDPMTDAQVDEASTLWGIYVGEVIRRYYGGQWTLVDGVPDLALAGKHASPLAKVRKRIVGGPMDNLKYYFTAIMKVLSSQQSQ